jgi:TonB family protein
MIVATGGNPERVSLARYVSANVVPHWVQDVWLAGAAILLSRLFISFLLLHRSRKDVAAPVAFGILRPEILLPKSAARWTMDILNSVMLHEQGHVQRRDGLAQLFAQLSCVFLWFQPLAWYAARNAAEEREKACDDLVLQGGVPADEYASHLLFVARESLPVAALPMARRSSLESRFLAITDERRSRAAVSPRWRTALAAAAVVAMLGVSSLRGQQEETIYRVDDKGVTAPALLRKVDVEYTPEARANGVSGSVTLAFQVATDGSPREIKVVESLDRGLDQNAVAAVRQWRFKPAMREGKPVVVAVKVKVGFQLR